MFCFWHPNILSRTPSIFHQIDFPFWQFSMPFLSSRSKNIVFHLVFDAFSRWLGFINSGLASKILINASPVFQKNDFNFWKNLKSKTYFFSTIFGQSFWFVFELPFWFDFELLFQIVFGQRFWDHFWQPALGLPKSWVQKKVHISPTPNFEVSNSKWENYFFHENKLLILFLFYLHSESILNFLTILAPKSHPWFKLHSICCKWAPLWCVKCFSFAFGAWSYWRRPTLTKFWKNNPPPPDPPRAYGRKV